MCAPRQDLANAVTSKFASSRAAVRYALRFGVDRFPAREFTKPVFAELGSGRGDRRYACYRGTAGGHRICRASQAEGRSLMPSATSHVKLAPFLRAQRRVIPRELLTDSAALQRARVADPNGQ